MMLYLAIAALAAVGGLAYLVVRGADDREDSSLRSLSAKGGPERGEEPR